jgi:hypothetical protein
VKQRQEQELARETQRRDAQKLSVSAPQYSVFSVAHQPQARHHAGQALAAAVAAVFNRCVAQQQTQATVRGPRLRHHATWEHVKVHVQLWS